MTGDARSDRQEQPTVLAPGVLAGRIAVVTGAGTGIGRQIAMRLAELGADVVLAGRTEATLEAVAAEIDDRGGSAKAVVADVRELDDVDRLVAATEDAFGVADLVVNNAGGQFPQRFEEMSDNGWRSVIDLNLNGTRNVTHRFGRRMIGAGRKGTFVNIVASFVVRASPGIAHTGAARAGVVHLSRSLSLEWAEHGITINNVGPMVMTEGAETAYGPSVEKKLREAIPMDRWGDLGHLADIVAFLATPAADYVTGMLVPFDGGNYLGEGVSFA